MKRHHLLRFWSGPVVIAVVAAVFATTSGAGQNTQGRGEWGDVYVLERPEALTILNTYQQRLTPSERRAVEPFVPMFVINEHSTLSDGFTPCMSVDVDGQTFFLQRDRIGDLLGLERAGFHDVFRGVVVLRDSIRIVSRQTLQLSSADGSTVYLIHEGEILHRMFRQGDRTFVRRSSTSPRYGWIRLAEADRGRIWEAISPRRVVTSLSPGLVSRVEEKVQQVNETLRRLFAFFNTETGAHRAAPQWQLRTVPTGLLCVLEADSLQVRFPKSTHQLMKEIEGILIGTMYAVRGTAGRIEITPRDRSGGNG